VPKHTQARHRITVEAPVERCFMYFTPAGEELWVEGWKPRYVHPPDGRTEAGMVFTTGEGDEHTIWLLADFDLAQHRSRYVRCTPASRTGTVEVRCRALAGDRTEVEVAYALTALTPAGEATLADFEGARFARMIDGWAVEIAARRDRLLQATIR
jgi:hypothetical protein